MRSPRSTAGCTFGIAVTLAASCLCLVRSAPAESAAPQPAIKIAASIFPLADIARQVGGDKVRVTTIIPSGSDPHNFEITPTGARAVNEADLVLLIAKHFDGWAMGSADAKRTSRFIEFETIFEDSLIGTGRNFNPHFWLDPMFARSIGAALASELTGLDPANRAYYEARAAAFDAKVDSLNASIKARLLKSGFKEYVAFHPAWTYFARRYGLVERAILERTPEQEPSAKWIAQVLKTTKAHGVKVIIAEEFSNKALAQTMASDSGAKLIVLDPLGGADRPGRDSYTALMDYNVHLIEEAARREITN